jgi:hypothetical protein
LLPTHKACNKSYELLDEKIGQLIALRYGKVPADPQHHRLKFTISPQADQGAMVNLDIDAAVWRWIAGFHAALYRESGVGRKIDAASVSVADMTFLAGPGCLSENSPR